MYKFNEIIGHEDIINYLQSVIELKKVFHTYIIEGEKGIGKKLMANTFAKTLQCENKGTEPCNQCNSCVKYDTLNHPDVIYVNPTKKTGFGVSDIREQINNTINIKPYQYPYKIYIVNEADTMTTQAQNALLKTIEEPPNYAIILLIAENSNKFLQTVLSRCVVLTLKAVTDKQIMYYLTDKEGIDANQAKIYTAFSRGNIGKVKELLSSTEFARMRDFVSNLLEIIIRNDDYEILEIAKQFEEYKEMIDNVFDLLLTWLRDLLIVKHLKEDNFLIHKDKYKILLKQAQSLSYNRICQLIDNINETRINFKVNVNYQLSIETMLLKDI